MKMKKLSRRDFVKTGIATSVALNATQSKLLAKNAKVDVWIFKGEDPKALMSECMKTIFANGGFGNNVKTLAVKGNIAWNRLPKQGVTTHPDLIDIFLEKTIESGIKNIIVTDRSRSKKLLERNGIGPILAKHNIEITPSKAGKNGKVNFVDIEIPNAKSLKTVKVFNEFVNADAVVNMPVAKHHGGANMTCSLKNWMGIVKDPRAWHRKNLHQCIADFSLYLKPVWTIVDAIRCMTSQGPVGPSEYDESIMIYPKEIILSQDSVAADAVASKYFYKTVEKVEHLTIASEMGIGVIDEKLMNIHRITV